MMNRLSIYLTLMLVAGVSFMAWADSPLGQPVKSPSVMPEAPISSEEIISPLGDEGEIIEKVELDLYGIISSREPGTRVYIEEGVTTVEKKDGTFYINTEGINPDGTGAFEIYDISGNEETNNE